MCDLALELGLALRGGLEARAHSLPLLGDLGPELALEFRLLAAEVHHLWVPAPEPLVESLLRLSNLAVGLRGKISAVDINPIGLNNSSAELTVLDAKIHL